MDLKWLVMHEVQFVILILHVLHGAVQGTHCIVELF